MAAMLAPDRIDLDSPYALTDRQIAFYRESGFVKLKDVFTPATLARYGREITTKVHELNTLHLPMEQRTTYQKAFLQVMNLWTKSDVVRDFVNELGANAASILYDDRARNTHENATLTYELVHPKPGERWILICQAIGMPRAVGAFRRTGWDVIPFPAGYVSGSKRPVALSFDLLGGLSLAYFAAHEWGGLIAYRLMGYTDEVFPR